MTTGLESAKRFRTRAARLGFPSTKYTNYALTVFIAVATAAITVPIAKDDMAN